MSIDRSNFDAPDFINIDFFERTLRNGLDDPNIKIEHVVLTGGTKSGENYCSELCRTSVTYSSDTGDKRTIPLIVKYLPRNSMGDFFREAGIFNREYEMYVEVLPKLKDIMDDEEIAPKYFYYTETPTEIIVLEDLSPKNYRLGDAAGGLDETHCKLLLEKLGRYHAASMVLIDKYPEIFEKFKENLKMPKDDSEEKPKFYIENFIRLAKVVATWPDFEETAKKIEALIPRIDEEYDEWSGPQDNEIKVLAHNDLWTFNVLFKYEENEPIHLCFIDFQIAFFSSPGIDLMHFFYTSPKFEVLEKRREYLVREHYYRALKTTLDNLKYPNVPSLADILEEMRKREIVGFMWSMLQLLMVCIDSKDFPDKSIDALNDPDKGSALRQAGMTSERFVNTMKYMLRKMEDVGVLI